MLIPGGSPGAAVGAMALRARKRIVRDFLAAGATSAATAISYTPRGRMIDRRMFRRLVTFGAIVGTGADRYYLDPDRLQAYRASIRRRVLGVAAVLGGVVAAAFALG